MCKLIESNREAEDGVDFKIYLAQGLLVNLPWLSLMQTVLTDCRALVSLLHSTNSVLKRRDQCILRLSVLSVMSPRLTHWALLG